MNLRPPLLAVVVLLTGTSISQAQYPIGWRTTGWDASWYLPYSYGYPYAYGGYVGGWNPYYGPADAYADRLRGWSQARENVAESMRHYEQAREQYIENYDLWTDVQMERLRAQRELAGFRAEERRQEIEAYREAQELYRPEPLSSEQLNPETGEITWPSTLQQPQFAEERQQVEELFSMRQRGSQTGEIGRKVSVLVRLMELKLRDLIGEIPQQEYTAASNFLERLRNDAWSRRDGMAQASP